MGDGVRRHAHATQVTSGACAYRVWLLVLRTRVEPTIGWMLLLRGMISINDQQQATFAGTGLFILMPRHCPAAAPSATAEAKKTALPNGSSGGEKQETDRRRFRGAGRSSPSLFS